MTNSLDAVMKRHAIADAELGEACKPPVHRTLIWCYRTMKKTPRADRAKSIIAALAERGITITLDDLLTRPVRRKRSKAA